MRDNNNFIHEFVALSKCLPTLIDVVDEESNAQAAIREPLAAAVMTRMQSLLDTADPPVSWEDGVRRDVKEHNRTKYRGPLELKQPPKYAVDPDTGERVPSPDQLDTAEQQLVQARLQNVLLHQLDNLTAETSRGLMIERVFDIVGGVQAYMIPDPDQEDQSLNVYRFRLDLTPDK